MKIFKFGGASVKDAPSVRNVAKILGMYRPPYVVVVSAIGKTTNALEKLTKNYVYELGDPKILLDEIKTFHIGIVRDLFGETDGQVRKKLDGIFGRLEVIIHQRPEGGYDFIYDQIVSAGEALSTLIVSLYLNKAGIKNTCVDARSFIITDECHREGSVIWDESLTRINEVVCSDVIITQGFIGATLAGKTTTLGREGSDYSAAIIAYLLNADEIIIWKDVPGMLNADPNMFQNTRKLNNISYREAIELAFFGASVIHPKTIKPLQNKKIPLWIKSFLNPEEKGTLINDNTADDDKIPSFIFKQKQVLISISPKNFTFIVEENLSQIFNYFYCHKIRINLMQNSAINFSVCVDDNEHNLPELIKDLQKSFVVLYNREVELLTVRHYNEKTLTRLTKNKKILLEQKTRHTARFALKDV